MIKKISAIDLAEKKKARAALFLLIAFIKTDVFLLVEGLVNMIAGSAHSSSLYATYNVIVFFFCIVYFICCRPKLTVASWMFAVFVAIWGLVGFLQVYIQGFSLQPIYFFIFCFDVTLLLLYVIQLDAFSFFSKFYGNFILFYAIGLLVTEILSLGLTGQVRRIGNDSYQTASYGCAYCFGMIGLYTSKSSWFREKHKYAWILMPLLAIGTILPGGRGGFVLLFAFCVWLFGLKLKNSNFRWFGLRKHSINAVFLSVLLLFFVIVVVIFVFDEIKPFLQSGIDRALAYIDFSNMSLDLEGGSSGRMDIYEKALSLIAEKPFLGYGIFGYLYIGMAPYPHNLLIEIWMQYGVVLGTLVLFFIAIFEIKLLMKANFVIVGFSIYAFVNLMFSSSYTCNQYFWFVMVCAVQLFLLHKTKLDEQLLDKTSKL